jgi:hypothetical protein
MHACAHDQPVHEREQAGYLRLYWIEAVLKKKIRSSYSPLWLFKLHLNLQMIYQAPGDRIVSVNSAYQTLSSLRGITRAQTYRHKNAKTQRRRNLDCTMHACAHDQPVHEREQAGYLRLYWVEAVLKKKIRSSYSP